MGRSMPISQAAAATHVSQRLTNISHSSTDRHMSVSGERDTEKDGADGVDPAERKERILHTRVPDSLDRHIKRRARSLGMSASTVVRNVLLTTFGLVEDIVNDSTDIALEVTGQEAAPRRDRLRERAAT